MGGFARVEFADELEKFFKKNDAMTAKNAVQQSLESIRLNVWQLARDGRAIVDYIKEILLEWFLKLIPSYESFA